MTSSSLILSKLKSVDSSSQKGKPHLTFDSKLIIANEDDDSLFQKNSKSNISLTDFQYCKNSNA